MKRLLPTLLLSLILSSRIPLVASEGLALDDSLRYKIGQMLVFGFWGDTVPEHIKTEIRDYNVGGVLLYRIYGNLKNRTQIPPFITDLQSSANIPLLIATDQEGGTVCNLDYYNGFRNTQSAYQLGQLTDEATTRDVGSKFSNWFTELGINTNLAPVVDLRLQPGNVIGNRSYGADPDTVIQNAYWFIDEFRKQDLITTLKHFPGHGSSIGDSHLGFTDVTDTWTDAELIPFKALIDTGYVDMVMTAHIFNAHLDSLYPATLSRNTITHLLRDSLAFDGVVITDAMMMRAITDHYGLTESITLAINAGCDLILYNWDDDRNGNRLAPLFVNHVEQEVIAGRIPRDRIEASYRRILRLKSGLPTNTPVPETKQVVPAIFRIAGYPNPFNARTTIVFELTGHAVVRADIFNLKGERIRTLMHETRPPGIHRFEWDAVDAEGSIVPTGIYILRIHMREGHRVLERTLKLSYIR